MAPHCSVSYTDQSLACEAPDLVQSLPSVVDVLVPDYALTSSDLTLSASGHLFDHTHSYICLFNQ